MLHPDINGTVRFCHEILTPFVVKLTLPSAGLMALLITGNDCIYIVEKPIIYTGYKRSSYPRVTVFLVLQEMPHGTEKILPDHRTFQKFERNERIIFL